MRPVAPRHLRRLRRRAVPPLGGKRAASHGGGTRGARPSHRPGRLNPAPSLAVRCVSPSVRDEPMYVPGHFAETDLPTLHSFIDGHPFGLLVSVHDGRPMATHLPLILDRSVV